MQCLILLALGSVLILKQLESIRANWSGFKVCVSQVLFFGKPIMEYCFSSTAEGEPAHVQQKESHTWVPQTRGSCSHLPLPQVSALLVCLWTVKYYLLYKLWEQWMAKSPHLLANKFSTEKVNKFQVQCDFMSRLSLFKRQFWLSECAANQNPDAALKITMGMSTNNNHLCLN